MSSVSDKAWGSISESDYPTASSFCSASLIDLNPSGQAKSKANCKLPVREPGGALNRGGVHAAASVLAGGRGGVNAPPEAKRAAARKLLGHYSTMGETPPDSLKRLAQG